MVERALARAARITGAAVDQLVVILDAVADRKDDYLLAYAPADRAGSGLTGRPPTLEPPEPL
jgi:hypothetical protein